MSSVLLKFPEFVNARKLAEVGKWSAASADFGRCAEVMSNAKLLRESAIVGLFRGLCNYYGGRWDEALNEYTTSFVELSKIQLNSKEAQAALRYKTGISLSLEALGSNDKVHWQTILTPDPETRLCLGQIPKEASCYSRRVFEYLENQNLSLPEPASPTENILQAFSLLTIADRAVGKLAKANSAGIDISSEVEMVTKSLKSGERIASSGPAHHSIAMWYVGRSLLLRGTLFEFNANALMAEGMYRAACDLEKSPLTPRHAILTRLANRKLGELLSKWEKREREGEKLIQTNPVTNGAIQLLNTYIPEPTLFELDKLL